MLCQIVQLEQLQVWLKKNSKAVVLESKLTSGANQIKAWVAKTSKFTEHFIGEMVTPGDQMSSLDFFMWTSLNLEPE